jgi:hypothetical protein
MYGVAADVNKNMTGNENFADPAVPMPRFSAGVVCLQDAIINRGNGKLAKIELQMPQKTWIPCCARRRRM